jgi:hypothetical protein
MRWVPEEKIMKMKLVLMLIAGLAGGGLSVARAVRQEESHQLSPREGLELVRAINTIQAEMKLREQKYAGLGELLKASYFRRSPNGRLTVGNGFAGKLKDYEVSVVVSADGQHYQVSLLPSAGCARALFSNESGLIYEGKGLGCS